ncbi:MAG: family 16 glycosylhydrolase [Spirochaetaceae bacterium]
MIKKLPLIGLLFLTILGCKTEVPQETDFSKSELDWQLVWSDEFDADTIDESKWNFINGAGGYGNNELQYYSGREKNARIKKGNLIIEAHKEDFKGSPYTSAKLTTQGKGDWTYGRYEIRAKLPKGQGIWPAFWMMPTDYDIYGAWPQCGEIDIMEMIGHEPNTTHGTLHYGNPYKYTGESYTLEEGTFYDNYHTFAIDWLPGEIKWYVDGHLFQVQNDWYSNNQGTTENLTFPAPYDRDFYMQFNLAIGGNWPGNPDSTTVFPQKLIIDWIRVYQAPKYPRIKPKKNVKEKAPEPGREPQVDGNYVYNQSFTQGTDYWDFGNHEGGSGKITLEDEVLHVEISKSGGQIWANQLTQSDMNIQLGVEYRVTFKAKAATDRNLMIKIGGLQDRGWAAYSGEKYIDITTSMEEYSFDFTMKEKSDPKARYEVNMGLNESDIWLDDLTLTQIGGEAIVFGSESSVSARTALVDGNLIYNGTFDHGKGRLAYWNLETDDDSDVMLNVQAELYKREGNIVIIDSSQKPNGIVLFQDNIDIISNETYQVSFDAYSTGDRTFMVAIQNTQGDNLYGPYTVDLTDVKQAYKIDIPVISDSKNIRVSFLAAISGNNKTQKITLDNVSFVKLKKPIIIDGITKIEAEDYFDKTATPKTQDCSEGGLNVGWLSSGDWLKYSLDVKKAGTYIIRYRVASEKIESKVNKVKFEGSGGWQNWETIESEIILPAGETFLELTAVDLNINWIELELK